MSALTQYPLDVTTQKALQVMAKKVQLKKGELFFNVGDSVVFSGFVEVGSLREVYVTTTGAERIRNFVQRGEWVGAYSDFLAKRASRTAVEALEFCELLVFPMKQVFQLAEKNDGLSRFFRKTAEELYVKKSEREFELLTMNATQRYLAFQKQFPNLQVPAHQIASYLGVTPVHLSRLRRQLSE
jgi:CRP-like cAMP-binding protein